MRKETSCPAAIQAERSVIDAMRGQLLPRLQNNAFRLQPSLCSAALSSEDYRPIFPYHLHSHDFFEWVWCVENHSFLKIRDTVYRLDAGDFCLLPPGVEHADVHLPTLERYTVLWCKLQCQAISAHLNVYIPFRYLPDGDSRTATAPLSTVPLLTTLQNELSGAAAYRETVCRSLVTALLHLMLRALEAPPRDEAPEPARGRVAAAVSRYLHQHYMHPLSLDDVARTLHMSRNHLAFLYKRETGTTIGQTLTAIRLTHARALLLEQKLSVQEVSRAVGYANPEHFSRVFSRHLSVTPGRYGK